MSAVKVFHCTVKHLPAHISDVRWICITSDLVQLLYCLDLDTSLDCTAPTESIELQEATCVLLSSARCVRAWVALASSITAAGPTFGQLPLALATLPASRLGSLLVNEMVGFPSTAFPYTSALTPLHGPGQNDALGATAPMIEACSAALDAIRVVSLHERVDVAPFASSRVAVPLVITALSSGSSLSGTNW